MSKKVETYHGDKQICFLDEWWTSWKQLLWWRAQKENSNKITFYKFHTKKEKNVKINYQKEKNGNETKTWEKRWRLFKNKKKKHDIVLIEGSLHFAHQVITNYNGQEIRLVCWKFKNDDVESLKKSMKIVCIDSF